MDAELITVLIADDHAIIREALEAAISQVSDMTLVGQAETGLEAVALNLCLKPDVILLDLRMPDMDGLESLRAIKQDRPDVRVVILTGFDSDEDVLTSLRSGASGYILKCSPTRNMLAVIRGAHAGVSQFDPAVTARLAARVADGKGGGAGPSMVTKREMTILGLIARGHSNRRVGEELYISPGTVKSHLSHIFRKLDVADRTEAVVKAVQMGLIEI